MPSFDPLPAGRETPPNRPLQLRGGKIIDAEIIDAEISDGTIDGATITGATITGATIATSTITEEAWTATSYSASWANLGGAWQTGRYRVDSNGVVHVQGMIQSGTITPGTSLFTLPAKCRPAASLRLVTFSAAGVADATIQANGQLIIQSGWSATWTSIHFTWAT